MKGRFVGKTCILCPNPSSRVGEHVWPLWLLGDFATEGPFTTDKNGAAVTKRDGVTPWTSVGLPGSHVPMCSDCNARLNRTIEERAKPIVRDLIAWADGSPGGQLAAVDTASLVPWLLKVGLFGSHPELVRDNPRLPTAADDLFESFDPAWVAWMTAEVPPPDDFSVFVSRRARLTEPPFTGEKVVVPLPDVSVDGRPLNFMSRSFGFRGLNATIVWHPGWPMLHPLVESGEAVRLWPEPEAVDLTALPVIDPRKALIVEGFGGTHLTYAEFERLSRTPLSASSDPIGKLFGAHLDDASD